LGPVVHTTLFTDGNLTINEEQYYINEIIPFLKEKTLFKSKAKQEKIICKVFRFLYFYGSSFLGK